MRPTGWRKYEGAREGADEYLQEASILLSKSCCNKGAVGRKIALHPQRTSGIPGFPESSYLRDGHIG
jgi:hypothetical protein